MIESDDGYGVSTGYTYGYYRRLSPSWLRLMATIHSVPFPAGEPFRYFELGYGQGVSLNVHAATNPGEYWGTDYNPEHVKFARQMAEASGAPVHLLDLSFEELAERDDLPQFHVIVAHGIWSWISDSSRAAILRFVDKHLEPGGLLYLSYNALPGAASGIAVQRLIRTLTQSMDPALSESERFERARVYLRALESSPKSHFANYPKAKERLDRILNAKSTYVLHEYTVDAWEPMLLTDVAAALRPIGLEFIGSAELDSRTASQATDDGPPTDFGATAMQAVPESLMISEALHDFEIDQQFRSDLFVRGSIHLGTAVRTQLPMEQRFVLTRHPDVVDFVADEVSDEEDAALCREVLIAFSNRSDGMATFSDIASQLPTASRERISRSILLCARADALHPVLDGFDEVEAIRSRKLNDTLAFDRVGKTKITVRASPLVGAGVPCFEPVPAFEAAISQGAETANQLIHYVNNSPRDDALVRFSAIEYLQNAIVYLEKRKVLEHLSVEIL